MTIFILLAIVVGGGCLMTSFFNWRFGFYGLLLYLPFAGMASLLSGQSTIGLLAKDIVFVIPSYFAFFLLDLKSLSTARLPPLMTLAMGLLVIFVIGQMANPNALNFMVGAIGAKVWLLYLPLAYLANAAISNHEDMRRFVRTIILLSLVPIGFGLLQFAGIQTIGADNTRDLIYGGNSSVEQSNLLAGLEYGNTIYRINSTFAAVGPYYTYLLTIIGIAGGAFIAETERKWRLIAGSITLLAIVAAFMSGQRGAVLFVPLVLAPVMILGRRIAELGLMIVLVPILYVVSLSVSGADIGLILNDVGGFVGQYAEEYGWDYVIQALSDNPAGMGTGMNTGAARYAFTDNIADLALLSGRESYYIKAIVELSMLALPVVILILWMPFVQAIKLALNSVSNEIRGWAAGFAGFFFFVALLSGRAWPLDVDPVNVLFWVFLGVLCKLPALEEISVAEIEAHRVAAPSRLKSGVHGDIQSAQ